MKVQTSDDAKLNNGDEKGDPKTSQPSSSPYTIDYEIKPARQAKYINLSKLVLLGLAIIATFLACLIFARDLWGHKNAEKPERVHPAPRIMGARQNSFPFDDFMDDVPDPLQNIFGKDEPSKEDEPHVVKSTKITFKLLPKGEEFPGGFPGPIGMKKIGFGSDTEDGMKKIGFGSDTEDGMFDDMLKMVMSMMGQQERRPQPFGDLPFFDGLNNPRPMHPKLIIVRKLPTPQQADDQDIIKDFLSGFNAPIHISKPMEPLPLFPLMRPIQQKADHRPSDDKNDIVSRVLKDFGLGGPLGHMGIKIKPPKTETSISSPEGWTKYKGLVSKLAQQVDQILAATSNLKQTVLEELNKLQEQSDAPAQDSEAAKPANPTKAFLTSALDSLNKMGIALIEVSVVIKTEDGAMDLVHKTDKPSLVNTIDSFLKELNLPLGEVFSTSTALTKMAGNERVSQPVLQGIVSAASMIVDFGKIIYNDISKLPTTVSESIQDVTNVPEPEQPNPNPEPIQPLSDSAEEEPKKMNDPIEIPSANLIK